MEPIAFLALHYEFPGLSNVSGVQRISPGLPEARSAINYYPSAISLLNLLVYDLDLLVEHFPSKPVNREVHPVMLLAFDNKIALKIISIWLKAT
jgi:hypothetical protein